MSTRENLIEKLIMLPHRIAEAELELIAAEENRDGAARYLQTAEDACLLDGIDGKNEAIRSEQLRPLTVEPRRVLGATAAVAARKAALHLLHNEFVAARTIARLMGGGE